jgi:hypothetical protein
VSYETEAILLALQAAQPKTVAQSTQQFGAGRSAQLFVEALMQPNFWDRTAQKQFRDVH